MSLLTHAFLAQIILAFSMSADAFAVALCKGAALRQPRLRDAMRMAALFGVVEAATPIIGWGIGLFASQIVASVDHWIAFGLLSLIGLKMIYEGMHADAEMPKKSAHRWYVLALTALGTSIDALAVGVTLAFIDVSIWLMAAMIGTATFVMVTIGIMAGHYIGTRAGKVAEILGGVCLIAIGTKILHDHLTALS